MCRMVWLPDGEKKFHYTLTRFNRRDERDGQTDRQTDVYPTTAKALCFLINDDDDDDAEHRAAKTSASPSLAIFWRADLRSAGHHACVSDDNTAWRIDVVSTLQSQLSAARFLSILAHRWSVEDGSELGCKLIYSHRPRQTSENFSWTVCWVTYL